MPGSYFVDIRMRFGFLIEVATMSLNMNVQKFPTPSVTDGDIEKKSTVLADQIFKRIAALNSDKLPGLPTPFPSACFLVFHV
jgi:hypothetical protein